ncbi:MAG: hydroxyacylglutathione hydrolase [Methylococcaceae bacterium]|nr:hydroxyacylglutathione hydrolase [Methylococcaceae bacterium]
MLEIVTLPVLTDNYIYIVHDPVSKETVLIDPALSEPVLNVLNENGWRLNYILNTHHHSDHVGGNLQIKHQTGCKIIGAKADWERIPGIDCGVDEGDTLKLGSHTIEVMTTPGHTRAHLVYYFPEDYLLFCGDTLFVMGCGRLFEGTPEQMWHSLQKIKSLPKATKIYCTHEYTQNNGRFALSVEPGNQRLQQRMSEVNHLRINNQPTVPSTIAEECATNPFLREDSPEIRRNLNLITNDPIQLFASLRRLKDNF